ncbi:MAG: hypothetical protein NTV93_14925 [Verrucomicrobia bacterium]|nr:hypothetical protein [Verrucomicrobiota bacterium]
MNTKADMTKGIPVPGKWIAAILVFPRLLEPDIRQAGFFRPTMRETPDT